ncbi:Ldh family oxidoreductase [Bosea sp. LjRoot9]|uniref:Ldh family oxidoreductase n=1 Tax=Bosea sp. LjRoot9 TaxID=3342341 RepID=UPI003ECF6816
MAVASKRMSVAELEALIQRALGRAGLAHDNIAPVAHSITACERDGVKGHGLLRLPGFVHSLATGWADGTSRPQIVSETDSLLTIDAHNGFAQVALASTQARLKEMARKTGVAVLSTRNSHHFSAIWPDIEPFAEDGFVAFSCVNSKKRMAAWGGGRPVIGTNAMAFAAPRTDGHPLVWDQSSSVLSQGDVLLAAKEGRSLELGVGCDADGRPTTSPAKILEGGALLPFGGPKGASLAVMVEILAAALTGGPFGFEDSSPSGTTTTSLGGQFLLIIDPRRSTGDFYDRMAGFCAALVEAGSERLPGDRRYSARALSLANGIELDGHAFESLLELAGADKDCSPDRSARPVVEGSCRTKAI